MEDSIIGIVLILLMLSLITEKLSNFIKLSFSSTRDKAGLDSLKEKQREKKIGLLSISMGIVVALSSGANFFKIAETGNISPWTSVADVSFISIFGCIITGIFLSQGSKFFHDLLDTLLYFKNIKRTIYGNKELIHEKLKSGEIKNAENLVEIMTRGEREIDEEIHL